MNTTQRVYLDYAATTPLDPRVLAAMLPHFAGTFANSSSTHFPGQQAEGAVEESREQMAGNLGCLPEEILFTSGGSESDNLALRGVAFAMREIRGADRILISPVEHSAVQKTAEALRDHFGFALDILPVDGDGMVDPDALDARLTDRTALVSVIHASNEIGTLQPIDALAARCRARSIPFHTDSVQAAAHLDIDLRTLPVDLLSIGAHKFYGPKGAGALFVRKNTPLLPVQTGGGHERNRRAGTHNVPGIVGMAAAHNLAIQERTGRVSRVLALRDRIIARVLASIPDSRLTGHPAQRLPNHASFALRSVKGNDLIAHLDLAGFAVSSGSACKTGLPEPSGILAALGLDDSWTFGSLRVTLGASTSEAEVESFLSALSGVVERLRHVGAAA